MDIYSWEAVGREVLEDESSDNGSPMKRAMTNQALLSAPLSALGHLHGRKMQGNSYA
jgi:hypothetical protein